MRIDLLVSNDRHHVAIFEPVARRLLEMRPRAKVRVLSLCEFRGMPSPHDDFAPLGIEVAPILGRRFRSSPSVGAQARGWRSRVTRRVARILSWHLLLGRQTRRLLTTSAPDVVAVPNDAGFPFNLFCRELRGRALPFVLVQEGIRFPRPASTDMAPAPYGTGGASRIAAWGETSRDFFVGQGIPEDRVVLTGTPRFEDLDPNHWRDAGLRLREQLDLGPRVLLFLSSLIDTIGFCSTQEKLALTRRFAHQVGPLLEARDAQLVIKLHGQENVDDVREAVSDLPHRSRIRVTRDGSLYGLFSLAQAAVVTASTAGLEALLFGLPLGVLEIPGYGFVHDFVSGKAAAGLVPNSSLPEAVASLVDSGDAGRMAREKYLARTLSHRSAASHHVAEAVVASARTVRPA